MVETPVRGVGLDGSSCVTRSCPVCASTTLVRRIAAANATSFVGSEERICRVGSSS